MKKLLFILIGLYCNNIYSQLALKDFILVKSLQSKSDKTETAIISLTAPKGKSASFLINAALGYDLPNNTERLFKIYPFIEYNRNTLIDKVQHQFQSGFTFEWVRDKENKKFQPYLLADTKYSVDFEKNVKSIQSSFSFSPKFIGVNTKFKNFYFPDNLVTLGANKFFGFEYVPYVGFESENRLKVAKDSLKGNIYRFVFRIQSNFYFFPFNEGEGANKSLKFHRVNFSISYDYRNELVNTSLVDLSNNNFLQLGLNYTLYKNDDIDAKFGIDYTRGANPTKSFENQNYYGVSFKIKM